jgi:hypothetical protein
MGVLLIVDRPVRQPFIVSVGDPPLMLDEPGPDTSEYVAE